MDSSIQNMDPKFIGLMYMMSTQIPLAVIINRSITPIGMDEKFDLLYFVRP